MEALERQRYPLRIKEENDIMRFELRLRALETTLRHPVYSNLYMTQTPDGSAYASAYISAYGMRKDNMRLERDFGRFRRHLGIPYDQNHT